MMLVIWHMATIMACSCYGMQLVRNKLNMLKCTMHTWKHDLRLDCTSAGIAGIISSSACYCHNAYWCCRTRL